MEFGAEFWMFVGIGLLAQLVDGALGMAFGLVSSSVLLAMGLPPATASAAVHAAEIGTTGVSGLAHWRRGNVDRALFLKLAIPGAIGGLLGAWALSSLPGDAAKPFVLAYLFVLALVILARALRRLPPHQVRRVPLLGFFAGMLDAVGGGGWGPMATSSLLAQGQPARTGIGSVNAAEFVVTLAVSLGFFLHLGTSHLEVVLGLLLGGVIAAPLAARLVSVLPERAMLVAVGVLVLGLASWGLWPLLRGALAAG
jgi:uncharacterized membrane protein YfcA